MVRGVQAAAQLQQGNRAWEHEAAEQAALPQAPQLAAVAPPQQQQDLDDHLFAYHLGSMILHRHLDLQEPASRWGKAGGRREGQWRAARAPAQAASRAALAAVGAAAAAAALMRGLRGRRLWTAACLLLDMQGTGFETTSLTPQQRRLQRQQQ